MSTATNDDAKIDTEMIDAMMTNDDVVINVDDFENNKKDEIVKNQTSDKFKITEFDFNVSKLNDLENRINDFNFFEILKCNCRKRSRKTSKNDFV